MTFLILCTATVCSLTSQTDIERLLNMAGNYRQVEQTILLLKRPNPIIDHVPCISPLRAEDFRHLRISSAYGTRLHPLLNEYKHHAGIDLPGNPGEWVYATAGGMVAKVGRTATIGKFIRLRHDYGFMTLYGHLSSIDVAERDSVHIGQAIGRVGSTGRSTGPHLHYGVSKNGIEQNPLPYCYLYLRWQKMLIGEGKKYIKRSGPNLTN